MPALSPIETRILYEDNHLIVVNKMPSEIVQGDKTGDEPLSETLKSYLKKKYNKPGNVFLGVTHRIDRPVSGAVLFTKTSKALGRINRMLHDGDVRKIYWAVVKEKPPKKEDHLVHWLVRDKKKNKSFVAAGNTDNMASQILQPGDKPTKKQHSDSNSKKAELQYKIIDTSDQYYMLQIELLTGRHHQIRAQLSAIGCPIKGDLKYGYPRSNKDASIHLHARSIEFTHPVEKVKITIKAPPPDDVLWMYFSGKNH